MGGQWGDELAGGAVYSPGPFLSLVVGVGRRGCAVFLAFVLTWGSSVSLPCVVGFAFRFRCVGPVLGCRAHVRGARRGCWPWGCRHALVHMSRRGRWVVGVRLRCFRGVGGPGLDDLGDVAVAFC